uniref:Putative zinc finger protein n=1 Tax=Rhipicephalus pulchellus TaxID=72859 RepID=L7LXT3_RHIPC
MLFLMFMCTFFLQFHLSSFFNIADVSSSGVYLSRLASLFCPPILPCPLAENSPTRAGLDTVHPHPVQPPLGFAGGKPELKKCLVCGYTTIYGTTMKIHQRTHTGERPFKCDHCGKAFIHKGNLVTHVRTHTGERPFQCHLCPRVFTRKKYLAHHLNTHDAFG